MNLQAGKKYFRFFDITIEVFTIIFINCLPSSDIVPDFELIGEKYLIQ